MRSVRCSPRPGWSRRSTAPPGPTTRPPRSRTRSATRSWSARRTSSGGRGMEIVYDDDNLRAYIDRATEVSPEHPVLVDRFLDDAIEVDVDALYDGTELFLAGVMEHIEEAGIHSGDSACALPPITLGRADIARIREATEAIADGVGVRGLLNVQFALAGDVLYVLEANPRASRTVPFVAKATAVPLAKAAARVMLGASIAELRGGGNPAGRRRRGPAARRADLREGSRPAVEPLQRRRHRARPGDEVDRRGDGGRRGLRHRVREVPGGGVRRAADEGTGVRLGRQPRQAASDLPGEAARRPRLRGACDRRHRRGTAAQRRAVDRRPQALGRPRSGRRADDRGPDRRRRGRPDRQHAVRQLGPAARRLRDPHRRGDAGHPVPHDGAGARRRRAGDRGAARRRDRRRAAAATPRADTLPGRRGRRSLRKAESTEASDASAGQGRGAQRQADRRLLLDDRRRVRHRRAAPGPASSSPSRSAATTAECCCAARSRSTRSARPASTAARSSSSSR